MPAKPFCDIRWDIEAKVWRGSIEVLGIKAEAITLVLLLRRLADLAHRHCQEITAGVPVRLGRVE